MLENMDRWAVVAQLIKSMRGNQGWAGETHVQKTLFFLQEMLQVPSGYEFVLYKHGPYSFDLHDDLGRMLTNSVLALEPRPPYGPSFGLQSVGENLIQRRTLILERYSEQIKFIVETLGKKDVRELERLGTALLLRKEFPGVDQETFAAKIVEHKPHVPENLAFDSVREVSRIEENARAAGVMELK